MTYKRTGRHVGAPTREERRAAYQTKLESLNQPLYGPPVPKGLGGSGVGWGGSRAGSGRKKKEPGPEQFILVRVPFSLKLALEALPDGSLSEYVRKALDLLADILPPEKFKLAETKLPETEENPNNGTSSAE
jgi:hypothetical protein